MSDSKPFFSKTLMPVVLAAGFIVFSLPANAQYSINGEQPAVGPLHEREAQLLQQLNNNYQKGLIDPFELSNLTRDLDAIRVREEALRMRKQGMTDRGTDKIARQLDAFENDLTNRCGQNATAQVSSR